MPGGECPSVTLCEEKRPLSPDGERALFIHPLWRREIQNKNGANSKTTEYAANIQKADLEEALQARYLMCSVQFPAVALQL